MRVKENALRIILRNEVHNMLAFWQTNQVGDVCLDKDRP